MITSPKKWREERNRGSIIEFPSGFVGRVRPITVAAFLNLPNIPDSLSSVVHDMIYGSKTVEVTPDANEQFYQVLDALFSYAVIEPQIVNEPTDREDALWIGDIDFDDKQFLLGLLDKPVRKLETFRPQSAGDVEPVSA